jgi:hypothetical protein
MRTPPDCQPCDDVEQTMATQGGEWIDDLVESAAIGVSLLG